MDIDAINAKLAEAANDFGPQYDDIGDEQQQGDSANPDEPDVAVSQPETTAIRPRVLVDAYLQDNGIEFTIEPGDELTKFVIPCPFNPEHEHAYIGQFFEGAVFFKCEDKSCIDKKWAAVKRKIGKPKGSHYDPPKKDRKQPTQSRPDAGIDATELNDGITDWTDLRFDMGRTDVANARRFLAQHGDKVRFCHAWGVWLLWDGTRWKIDADGAVMRLAKAVADSIWLDARDCMTKDVVQFAVATSGAAKLSSMLKLAAADVPIAVDELDANPWLLNCPNGTLDLRTGELRPHRREDCLTKLCPTNFTPGASSESWDRFLDGVFADPETVEFLQRFAGYCLTGSVQEQVLAVLWGDGSNGKSTFLTALQDAIGGDYSMAAPSGLLTVKKNETHPCELADLFGMRFVVSQETESGGRLAESLVKALTGGDRVRARRMRENFWQFAPSHKLCVCTNHKPQVRGNDHAIWRRLLLIAFTRKFWNPDKGESGPDELRQDKTLPAKLQAETEGILAWAVQGCLQWQRDGLRIPESVRASTEQYRTEQDALGRFVSECCMTGQGLQAKFSTLYSDLEKWCNEGGDNLPTRRFFGGWLKDRGFKEHSNNGRWYLGIGLKAETQPDDFCEYDTSFNGTK